MQVASATAEACFRSASDAGDQCDLARTVAQRSREIWGPQRATILIGRSPPLVQALERLRRFAASQDPVLLTGETGTGKELFARALFALSERTRRPFLSVNCAQYCTGDLMASELFGHKKGSFTGAVADRRGLFEEAQGGVVFLDEIGEMTLSAQAMLLRVLSEGEVVSVGSSHARPVDVRVIAATSRSLPQMVAEGKFRADLYYRLRFLQVEIPAVRDRGDDWHLIAQHYLARLVGNRGVRRTFGDDALRALRGHAWRGNVREIRSVVETGFHMCLGGTISLDDIRETLAVDSPGAEESPSASSQEVCARMLAGEGTFWDVVHGPFMDRELNRSEVQRIVWEGLRATHGSYKRLLEVFGIAPDDYLKFMDFLRHHRLKPDHALRA